MILQYHQFQHNLVVRLHKLETINKDKPNHTTFVLFCGIQHSFLKHTALFITFHFTFSCHFLHCPRQPQFKRVKWMKHASNDD
jgi:hypothetical protein